MNLGPIMSANDQAKDGPVMGFNILKTTINLWVLSKTMQLMAMEHTTSMR